ncbi:MAG: DNA mismatch repair endonuclease MutL [Clostridia bacterium]|nr:DNA mismatch repair endonuclease MutL [Clostridia bacterium]
MGIINVLDIQVANMIAAGEVVDRPASAVKELVENAIDAGSTKITVEIKKGGISFIRVCDNGKGMSREDVPVCIQRHATSKISNQWDLGKITTLGFRGEALAAISSVSKVRIMTKRREDKIGTLMICTPGEEVALAETGCPDGTTVIVEELFANVPARRKFLKKDMTEGMAIANMVEKLALSRPDISFKFIYDDVVKFVTAGDNKLINVIYALYGRDFARKMTKVDWLTEGVKVYGYIGNPDNVKNNRNSQIVFVNDRYIRNKTVSAAIEQAFDSYIPEGKFPCCVLKIDVHPAFVDANVHPTKAEVKFSDERQVFDAVYTTVRSSLEKSVTRPEIISAKDDFNLEEKIENKKREGIDIINSFVPIEEKSEKTVPEKLTFTNEMDKTLSTFENFGLFAPPVQHKETKQEQKQEKVWDKEENFEISLPFVENENETKKETPKEQVLKISPDTVLDDNYGGRNESPSGKYVYNSSAEDNEKEEQLPFYRIIGEAFYSYIFVEMADKVLIIDKHAAHERMIFEELKKNMKKKKDVLQFLVVPEKVELDSVEKAAVNEFCDEISAIGFEIRTEENGDVMLYAVPMGLSLDEAIDLFMSVCTRLATGTGSAVLSKDIVFEKALYQASCKAAIKAGRPDAYEDTQAFVRKLMALPDIKYCPHGRPVAFEISKDSIEKQFKRK